MLWLRRYAFLAVSELLDHPSFRHRALWPCGGRGGGGHCAVRAARGAGHARRPRSGGTETEASISRVKTPTAAPVPKLEPTARVSKRSFRSLGNSFKEFYMYLSIYLSSPSPSICQCICGYLCPCVCVCVYTHTHLSLSIRRLSLSI